MLFLEMSKYYKIHKNFDLDYMTLEDPCRCSINEEYNIFTNPGNYTQKHFAVLEKYNVTKNGAIHDADDIEWDQLKRSECIA